MNVPLTKSEQLQRGTVTSMTVFNVPFYMGERLVGFDVPEPNVLVDPQLPAGAPMERMAVLCAELANRIAADPSTPVIYAGDCVAPIGVLAGLERRGSHATIVWFDAHGDFNTWETTPSGFIGGMPLAMLTGRGEQTIVTAAGLEPLPDRRAVLVGARDLDPGEDDAIAESAMTVSPVFDVVDRIPGEGPLYVHVDVDVVDPEELPAVNYPAPGGPSTADVATAVSAIAATGRTVAFSISSWNPQLTGAEVAAAATRTIAAPFLDPQ